MEILPQPVKPGLPGLIEHKPREMVVLAIEDPQRQDLVHRHDLRITERRGKEAAIGVHRGLESPPRGRVSADQNRAGEGELPGIGEDLGHPRVAHDGLARNETGRASRRPRNHVDLNAALMPCLFIKRRGCDEFTPSRKIARKTNRNHRWRANADGGAVDRVAVGVLAEDRRIESSGGPGVAQQKIRTPFRNQSRLPQNNEVVLVAVAGVGDHQRDHDFLGIRRRCRHREADVLLVHHGRDRFHPLLRAALPSDQADGTEDPQALLPGRDVSGKRGAIPGSGRPPPGPKSIQKLRRLSA